MVIHGNIQTAEGEPLDGCLARVNSLADVNREYEIHREVIPSIFYLTVAPEHRFYNVIFECKGFPQFETGVVSSGHMPNIKPSQNRGISMGTITLRSDDVTELEADIPAHFLLQFLDREQFIWLYYDEKRGVPEFDGDLKFERFYQGRFQTQYVIIGHGTIRYGDTGIVVSDNGIVANGVNLGDESNTVIDLDNVVHPGAFIRTFE